MSNSNFIARFEIVEPAQATEEFDAISSDTDASSDQFQPIHRNSSVDANPNPQVASSTEIDLPASLPIAADDPQTDDMHNVDNVDKQIAVFNETIDALRIEISLLKETHAQELHLMANAITQNVQKDLVASLERLCVLALKSPLLSGVSAVAVEEFVREIIELVGGASSKDIKITGPERLIALCREAWPSPDGDDVPVFVVSEAKELSATMNNSSIATQIVQFQARFFGEQL